jgi:hypothetical protein
MVILQKVMNLKLVVIIISVQLNLMIVQATLIVL